MSEFVYVQNTETSQSPALTPLPIPSLMTNNEDAPGKPCSCEKEQPTQNASGFTPLPIPKVATAP